MESNRFAIILSGLLLVPAMPVAWGGWAVVTVEELPDHVVVGRPIQLTFTVRQHGVSPMNGLKPTVELKFRGSQTQVSATPAREPGQYSASVTLPRAGHWNITINSGFNQSRATLLPVTAIDSGTPAPVISEADRGRHLFVAKGCVSCHLHSQFRNGDVGTAGPDLTNRRYPVEVLRQVMAPRGGASSTRKMPDLQLRPAEITALTAFINGAP